jgi:hypothetical protein
VSRSLYDGSVADGSGTGHSHDFLGHPVRFPLKAIARLINGELGQNHAIPEEEPQRLVLHLGVARTPA